MCMLDTQLYIYTLWIETCILSFAFLLKWLYFGPWTSGKVSPRSNWRNTKRLIRVIGPDTLQLTDGTRSFHADSIPFFSFFLFFCQFLFFSRSCSLYIPRALSAISSQPLDLPFHAVPAFNYLLPAREPPSARAFCTRNLLEENVNIVHAIDERAFRRSMECRSWNVTCN